MCFYNTCIPVHVCMWNHTPMIILCVWSLEISSLWMFSSIVHYFIFFKVIFLVILLLALLSHCFLSTLRYTQIDNRQTDRQVTDSAYERKCDIYLPESVLFYLPRRSLVSIIFQKMIQFLSLWLSKVHFCVLSHFNLFIYFLALSLGLYCHCCE